MYNLKNFQHTCAYFIVTKHFNIFLLNNGDGI